MGEHVFVINSHKVAVEILEKNANVFAARPQNMIMATDLIGWGRAVGLNPGGEQHRKYRRLLSKVLNSTAVRKFRPLEQRAAEGFLHDLYRSPDDFLKHIRNSVGNMIVELSYGRGAKVEGTEYIDYAEHVHEIFGFAARSFAFIVDVVPWLKHVPEWVPGAGFQKQAHIWRKELDVMAQAPFDMVKSDMVCVQISLLLWKLILIHACENLAKGSLPRFTTAFLTVFFLLMCLFPDVQARAQKEIDEVVGSDRLPNVEDEQRLPYVYALVREILRYWTIAPIGRSLNRQKKPISSKHTNVVRTGIPHRATEDFAYGSYVIPKGSTVIGNLWGMMHDPAVYSNPLEFKPERFLSVEQGGLGEPDPIPTVFGFGRRICPGMHLAAASVWTFSVCVLAAFKIEPIKNEKGETVLPVVEVGPEIISTPRPFKCNIIPRSSTTALLGL
ncbi:hypothetical protein EUX98_g701 [Antrodiella citrinella]|uniref:Cytochrome P450 n=1 Tax=Antrodiella citrinella TaxID=2447956 RepID=A0A4S4N4X7_9APHY|nr:hypothetical protein EUX98_g701 [Antrodiella citrinella]